jgi:hypothetical protein
MVTFISLKNWRGGMQVCREPEREGGIIALVSGWVTEMCHVVV